MEEQEMHKRLLAVEELLLEIKETMETNKELDDWIDERSTQQITGLKKSTLYKLRKLGKITSSRLGKPKVFYRKSDITKLLNENEKL